MSASWGTGGTCAIGACRATMGMIARFNVTHMTPAMGAVGALGQVIARVQRAGRVQIVMFVII